MRLCSRCQNHGFRVELRGHKRDCPYRNCQCDKGCYLTEMRQVLNRKRDWSENILPQVRFTGESPAMSREASCDVINDRGSSGEASPSTASSGIPSPSMDGVISDVIISDVTEPHLSVSSPVIGGGSLAQLTHVYGRQMPNETYRMSMEEEIHGFKKRRRIYVKEDSLMADTSPPGAARNESSITSDTELLVEMPGVHRLNPSEERRASCGIKHRILSRGGLTPPSDHNFPLEDQAMSQNVKTTEYTTSTKQHDERYNQIATDVVRKRVINNIGRTETGLPGQRLTESTPNNRVMPFNAGDTTSPLSNTRAVHPLLTRATPVNPKLSLVSDVILKPSHNDGRGALKNIESDAVDVGNIAGRTETGLSEQRLTEYAPNNRVMQPFNAGDTTSPLSNTRAVHPLLTRATPVNAKLSLISDVILKLSHNDGREALKKIEGAYQELLRFTYPPA